MIVTFQNKETNEVKKYVHVNEPDATSTNKSDCYVITNPNHEAIKEEMDIHDMDEEIHEKDLDPAWDRI